jgi:hypothetical protein
LPGSNTRHCKFFDQSVHCGPQGLPGETDLLYRNLGNGTFEEVSRTAGLSGSELHYGLGATWGDYDDDGWPDLYVANDAGANYLYHNKQNGTFEEVGMDQGVGLNSAGAIQGSMGVDFGDFDRDGRLDLVVTAFTGQSAKLYHNLGQLGFADVGELVHIAEPTAPYIGWGTGLVDLDNSGRVDLVIANGHVYPQADLAARLGQYRQPVLLFRSRDNGTYENASSELSRALPWASWRGLALADINNNGCLDLLISNIDGPPSLIENHCPSRAHSILFNLIGKRSNRAAIGARITIKAGKLTQMAEVRAGSSYMSQNDLRVHFGLNSLKKVDAAEIRWPSGLVDNIRDLSVNYIYNLVEGEGIRSKIPLRRRHFLQAD